MKLLKVTEAPIPHFQGSTFTMDVRTSIYLRWIDRIRVLFTGKIGVDTKVACERSPGKTLAVTVGCVLPPDWVDAELKKEVRKLPSANVKSEEKKKT
jgi:hypothetical protein